MNIKFEKLNAGSLASSLLDGTRFVAALSVVIYHMGFEFIPGYQAVMVFFVLSGFLISGSILSSMSNSRWSWVDYIVSRLVRLWVVLIPSLVVSCACVLIDRWFLEGKALPSATLNGMVMVKNILFLQFMDGQVFAGNQPLWSLAYEFWFYAAFPLLLGAFYHKSSAARLLCVVLFAVAAVFTWSFMEYFLIWILGAFAVFASGRKFSALKSGSRAFWAISLLACLMFFLSLSIRFIATGTNHPGSQPAQFFYDAFTGLAFAGLLFVIFSSGNNKVAPKWLANVTEKLSGFSFSLYLTHYPLMYLIVGVRKALVQPEVVYTHGFHVFNMACILAFAYVFSRYTEVQTQAVKRWLVKILLPKEILNK
jgi:peptidoglycan/LPS O-acetylase OafA/YrhL